MLEELGFGMSRAFFGSCGHWSGRCWGRRSGAGAGTGGEGRSRRLGVGLKPGGLGFIAGGVEGLLVGWVSPARWLRPAWCRTDGQSAG